MLSFFQINYLSNCVIRKCLCIDKHIRIIDECILLWYSSNKFSKLDLYSNNPMMINHIFQQRLTFSKVAKETSKQMFFDLLYRWSSFFLVISNFIFFFWWWFSFTNFFTYKDWLNFIYFICSNFLLFYKIHITFYIVVKNQV